MWWKQSFGFQSDSQRRCFESVRPRPTEKFTRKRLQNIVAFGFWGNIRARKVQWLVCLWYHSRIDRTESTQTISLAPTTELFKPNKTLAARRCFPHQSLKHRRKNRTECPSKQLHHLRVRSSHDKTTQRPDEKFVLNQRMQTCSRVKRTSVFADLQYQHQQQQQRVYFPQEINMTFACGGGLAQKRAVLCVHFSGSSDCRRLFLKPFSGAGFTSTLHKSPLLLDSVVVQERARSLSTQTKRLFVHKSPFLPHRAMFFSPNQICAGVATGAETWSMVRV